MNDDARFGMRSPSVRPETPSIIGAVMAGFGAAMLGAITWAVIVAVTDYELGFIAWGIGLLVGLSMSVSTRERSPRLGLAAAGFAVVGLVVGKLAISIFVLPGASVAELAQDDEFVLQAAAYHLQATEGFPEGVQERLDALAFEDTLSDALWDEMLDAADVHVTSLSPEERSQTVEEYTYAVFGQMGLGDMLVAQASVYDLLWLFLAVSTAWKMTAKDEEEGSPRAVEGGSGVT